MLKNYDGDDTIDTTIHVKKTRKNVVRNSKFMEDLKVAIHVLGDEIFGGRDGQDGSGTTLDRLLKSYQKAWDQAILCTSDIDFYNPGE